MNLSEINRQSDNQHCSLSQPATIYKYDRVKENAYLDRIARLMDTDRTTLDSYAKIKLWETGQTYQKVVKYVNNSQCHPNIKLTVVNIHRVWQRNQHNEDLFHISNRKLLWHGTKRANIPNILNNGFKLPASAGQMFGSGIYFADRISKSSNYSDLDVTFLLLCEVGLGRVYSCKTSHNTWKTAPDGFDSVKANGTYVPDWTDNERYFGAEIPFGRTAKCTKYASYAVNYNEFIVYDPSRVIIRFLVEVNVQKVLKPTPLKLITPTSVAPMNKTARKSTNASAADEKNLRIKIASTNTPSPAIQTTAKTFARSNNVRATGVNLISTNTTSAAIQTKAKTLLRRDDVQATGVNLISTNTTSAAIQTKAKTLLRSNDVRATGVNLISTNTTSAAIQTTAKMFARSNDVRATGVNLVFTNTTSAAIQTRAKTISRSNDVRATGVNLVSTNTTSEAIQTKAKTISRSNDVRASGVKLISTKTTSAAIQTKAKTFAHRNDQHGVPTSFPTSSSTIRCAHWVQESYSSAREEHCQQIIYTGEGTSYSYATPSTPVYQSSSIRYPPQADIVHSTCTIL